MKTPLRLVGVLTLLFQIANWAAVFGNLRGVVHDPDHRPIQGAEVVVKSSQLGLFAERHHRCGRSFRSVGRTGRAYRVTVTQGRVRAFDQEIVVASGSAPVLHFQLAIGARN